MKRIHLNSIRPRHSSRSLDRKRVEEFKTRLQEGQIEEITVEPINDYFEILDGHHWYEALKELGFIQINVRIKNNHSK